MNIDNLPYRIKQEIDRMLDFAFVVGLWLGFVLGAIVVMIYNLIF